MLGFGTSEGLLDVAVMLTLWVLSLDGPGVMPVSVTTWELAFSRIVMFVGALSAGGWLTRSTVIVKEFVSESTPPLAVPPLSLRVTVIVALPNWLVAGVNVSVPVALGLV